MEWGKQGGCHTEKSQTQRDIKPNHQTCSIPCNGTWNILLGKVDAGISFLFFFSVFWKSEVSEGFLARERAIMERVYKGRVPASLVVVWSRGRHGDKSIVHEG